MVRIKASTDSISTLTITSLVQLSTHPQQRIKESTLRSKAHQAHRHTPPKTIKIIHVVSRSQPTNKQPKLIRPIPQKSYPKCISYASAWYIFAAHLVFRTLIQIHRLRWKARIQRRVIKPFGTSRQRPLADEFAAHLPWLEAVMAEVSNIPHTETPTPTWNLKRRLWR